MTNLDPWPGAPLGVYIHFPFCAHRCPYCDFNLRVVREIPHEVYAEAVLAELEARAGAFEGRRLVSIYFGGGTPGLWAPECVARVIQAVRERWGLLDDPTDRALAAEVGDAEALEVTLEINPRQAPPEVLAALREAGVNRLSVGIQGFDPAYLAALGRDHDVEQALQTMADARDAGFERLSFDLLFGGPGHDLATFERDLEAAAGLTWADHVSAYSLILEPATRFGRLHELGRLEVADEEAVVEMLERCHQGLGEAGWRRYEVSSYARPGREARHNSLYWSGGEYMGLGVGAHEFALRPGLAPLRREGARRYRDYIADPVGSAQALEEIEPDLHLAERVYLGLRTRFGIDPEALEARFGAALMDPMRPRLEALEADGLVAWEQGPAQGPSYLWPSGRRLVPTERGVLFADAIAVEVLP